MKQGKPAPDIFLLAAERLGVEPKECLVFEDAPSGTEAATAAGMSVVVVPHPEMDCKYFKNANQIITSLESEYLSQERHEFQDLTIENLYRCLKKRSHENQAILQMKYFDKMIVEEVIKKLGRSFLPVQSLLDRLRKKLKNFILKYYSLIKQI